MKYETIIYEKEKGIATLTFNRPQAMNAQNSQQSAEMRAAVEEARNDDKVRVLIVTGAGRAFHAGQDVREVFLADDREKQMVERRLGQLKGTRTGFFVDFYKPIIAAVNGPAIGSGLEIALSCDIRLASENARFSYGFVLRGLIAALPMGVMILIHTIGVSRALEMMFSGEMMDAAEAERVGLVSKVVPQGQLIDEARELARKLIKVPPLAQQAVKRVVHRAMFEPSGLADFIQPLNQALHETEDHLEGSRAFAEKREPVYKGR